MPPLWMMYPNISQFSIGWRMGYGEGYKWDLSDWLKTLSPEDRKRYDEMFPRPKFWASELEDNYYDMIPLWEKEGKMKYSIGQLIEDSLNAELEYIFFWKPNPTATEKFCLGQWQPSKFEVDIHDYVCAEQYMMAEKVRLFEDKEIEAQIMQTTSPREMQTLGKKVKNFDQAIWDKVKYSIVLNANYYKFSQNKEMRAYLLATENKVLVEASPMDKIWGIGLAEEHPNAQNPAAWNGKNFLGFALMEVRDELKKLYRNYDKIDWKHFEKY